MGLMIRKLDPNDPKVARNRALFRAGIPSDTPQEEIGNCLIERIKECFEVAKAFDIEITHNTVFYDEQNEIIVFE